ncbi:protease [Guinea pig adenovirus]|nr:protease [Guinea pig adenovirus]
MGSCENEIRAIARDLGAGQVFLGTFDSTFPGFIRREKPACAVVNTARRHTGGAHWVAVAWEPVSHTFYMFDPYGFDDQTLKKVFDFSYQTLMKRSALTSTDDRCINVEKSTECVQGPHSAACGLYCCLFVYSFARWPQRALRDSPVMQKLQGVPTRLLQCPAFAPTFHRNQEYLYATLRRLSPYFRNREAAIRERTRVDRLLVDSALDGDRSKIPEKHPGPPRPRS